MREKRPTVFKDTVFPPVFGPVIISWLKPVPSSMFIGTTFFGSKSGCRAPFMMIFLFFENFGLEAFMPWASFARAKMKSSRVRSLTFVPRAPVCSAVWALSASRMRSISSCSFIISWESSLFICTTAAGSTNTVEPEDDRS